MVGFICNPSTWKVEARGSEVQGYLGYKVQEQPRVRETAPVMFRSMGTLTYEKSVVP